MLRLSRALAVLLLSALPALCAIAQTQDPPPATIAAMRPETLPLSQPTDAARHDPLPRPNKPAPGYHWTGLLVQTAEFHNVENAFRYATDGTLRSLLVTKPFWHDYIASLHHFDMNRWNDGDDFLTNYIGHPMQGAVAAYIEIQNSPTQSRIQFNQPGYWASRSRALLWATIFSTYTEIGPTGEAGLGNEGGFTYDTQCILHCNQGHPHSIHKYANNTGWVDFIVTPTAGTLWVIGEDAIDREIVERFLPHGPHSPMFAKIIRGSLTPTRTMANFMRGRKPWYRDWEYPDVYRLDQGPGMGFIQGWYKANGKFQAYPAWKRLEIAPHFTSFATTITTGRCHYCVLATQGAGIQFSYELWKYLYADADLSYQPNASPRSSDRAGGDLTTGFFGLRIGRHWPLYAVNVSLRPGFLHWNSAYLTSIPLSTPNHPAPPNSPRPQLGHITHFAWNALLAGDYKFNQHLALRAGISATIVRYRHACLDSSGIGISGSLQWLNQQTPCQLSAGVGKPPYISWLSHEDFVNRASWGLQFGPVFSF